MDNGKVEGTISVGAITLEVPRFNVLSDRAREVLRWHVENIINNPDAARTPMDVVLRGKQPPEFPIIEIE